MLWHGALRTVVVTFPREWHRGAETCGVDVFRTWCVSECICRLRGSMSGLQVCGCLFHTALSPACPRSIVLTAHA